MNLALIARWIASIALVIGVLLVIAIFVLLQLPGARGSVPSFGALPSPSAAHR
jgi:hypothetical protein